jgi:transposase
MQSVKENEVMTAQSEPAVKAADDPSESRPTSAQARIHWAGTPGSLNKQELEQKFEAMRSRNWVTDRMVEQYQKHWHCSREAALERLLAKAGA